MDLCIGCEVQASSAVGQQRVSEIFQTLARLGYTGAALDYATTLPLRPKDECRRGALPAAAPAPPSHDLVSAATVVLARGRPGSMLTKRDARRLCRRAGALPSGAEAAQAGRKRPRDAEGASGSSSVGGSGAIVAASASAAAGAAAAAAGAAAAPPPSAAAAPAFCEFRRITLVMDPSSGSGGGGGGFASSRPLAADLREGARVLASYDVVAAQPSDAAGLGAILSAGGGASIDIVSLDLSSGRLPFPLAQRDVAAVLGAGMVFELRYAPAVRDAALRRAFFTHAATLLRVTRGAGLLLTSGARNALELRSPRAVAAIASLAGFSLQQAHAALTAAPAAALAHAARRKQGGL